MATHVAIWFSVGKRAGAANGGVVAVGVVVKGKLSKLQTEFLCDKRKEGV